MSKDARREEKENQGKSGWCVYWFFRFVFSPSAAWRTKALFFYGEKQKLCVGLFISQQMTKEKFLEHKKMRVNWLMKKNLAAVPQNCRGAFFKNFSLLSSAHSVELSLLFGWTLTKKNCCTKIIKPVSEHKEVLWSHQRCLWMSQFIFYYQKPSNDGK